MTHRDRMLRAVRGEPVDQLPWAPRLDLWHIARRARGVLSPELQEMGLPGLADWLQVGCHAVRADFTRPRSAGDLDLRGLGLDNHPDYPYRTELAGLACSCDHGNEHLRTEITAPSGTVTFELQQTAEMTRAGISLPFVLRYPLTSPSDFRAVAEVFAHLRVVPTPDGYTSFRERVGERGVAVASGPLAASPMHLILHELVPMDTFFYLYADARPMLQELAQALEPYFEAVLETLAHSPAEVVFWGANYDQDLTWPAFFDEEIAPWLERVSARLHAAGKLLLTHTDGENRALLRSYPRCGFDVAESVCPAPMTRCSLAELREGMGRNTTVWGGIPSVALLPAAMDDSTFARFLDELFASLGDGRRLILGVSDNVPPDCDLPRLREIGVRASDFVAA